MVCLVVAAHGHLAEGLVASSAMIVGPSDDVVAVTFEPSEGPDDLLAKYAAAVEASSSQEYLILVDLFGGSPYNAAARFAAGRDDADVEAFKEIDSRGIKQYIQQVPSTASSDLMGALKEKGLL